MVGDERGQSMVEYALIIALVAVVVLAILQTSGCAIQGPLWRAGDAQSVPAAPTPATT